LRGKKRIGREGKKEKELSKPEGQSSKGESNRRQEKMKKFVWPEKNSRERKINKRDSERLMIRKEDNSNLESDLMKKRKKTDKNRMIKDVVKMKKRESWK
jgi:hypothetical protein